jgi:uncharacterized protein YutE (UPF0331/DUF86 family)
MCTVSCFKIYYLRLGKRWAVKKLHTLQQIAEFRNWIIVFELDKKILFNKVDEIKNNIEKIAEKWLQ